MNGIIVVLLCICTKTVLCPILVFKFLTLNAIRIDKTL